MLSYTYLLYVCIILSIDAKTSRVEESFGSWSVVGAVVVAQSHKCFLFFETLRNGVERRRSNNKKNFGCGFTTHVKKKKSREREEQ